MTPNRRQAFTWTNDDLVHWRIYASPGFGELIPCYMMHCVLFDVQSMINRNCLGKWPKPMMTKIFDALMRHQGTILSRVRLRMCHRYSITHAVSSIITMSQCKNVPCWRHGCVIIGAFCHLSFNIHCHQRTISRRVHELMMTVIKWKHFPRHWPGDRWIPIKKPVTPSFGVLFYVRLTQAVGQTVCMLVVWGAIVTSLML